MEFLRRIRQLFTAKQLERMPLAHRVQEAKEDWLYARQYFDMVSDADLVDHASYMIMAAEKRYMYLLKYAQHEGTRADIVNSLYSFNKSMTG